MRSHPRTRRPEARGPRALSPRAGAGDAAAEAPERAWLRAAALALGLAVVLLPAPPAPAADSGGTAARSDATLAALDPTLRERALAFLGTHACLCGCRLDLGTCRLQQPQCTRSAEIARGVTELLSQGQPDDELQQFLRSQPIRLRPTLATAQRPLGHGTGSVLGEKVHDIPIAGAPSRGPAEAPVTIVEFSDFQCPFCAHSLPVLRQLLESHPSEVQLVYKHFPLTSHVYARDAALAALAAQAQAKFWPMHDRLFANRSNLERKSLLRMAAEERLDMRRFRRDLESAAHALRVDADIRDGRAAGLSGTPTFYINGRKLQRNSLAAFRQAIEETLQQQRAQETLAGWCPLPGR